MSTKNISLLSPDFQHPGHIAPSRALAVRAVMHNDQQPTDWETLEQWVALRGLDAVLADIVAIVEANEGELPEECRERERRWWARQLQRKPAPTPPTPGQRRAAVAEALADVLLADLDRRSLS